MAKLTIWSAGVKVFPVEKPIVSTENLQSGQDKYATCLHKSEAPVEETKRTCCSSRVITGYKCLKLGIIPLTPERCKECLHYEAKPS